MGSINTWHQSYRQKHEENSVIPVLKLRNSSVDKMQFRVQILNPQEDSETRMNSFRMVSCKTSSAYLAGNSLH